jgi:hypothetical protein
MNGAEELQQDKFTGTVYGVHLTDLVQLACLSQMNVSIDVSAGEHAGAMHVVSGQVVHAASGDREGEEAFKAIMLFAAGRFVVEPLTAHAGASISKGWEHLLIDALRYRSERGGLAQGPSPQEHPTFAGSLKHIELLDLITLACIAKTDHVLRVVCGRGEGAICVRDGQVYHAQFLELAGEDAFKEMLCERQGSFEAVAPESGESTSIDTPWEYLIMEAMRYRDEKEGSAGEEGTDADTLTQRVQKMKVAEKIRLAMLGDKEARTLLMRDSNRMVQAAIVSNPRLTDGEVAMIASLRSIDEEVLRKIANNREWMRMYQVRLALATNPKCPFATSVKLLQSLAPADLKQISRSKSVPSNVAQAARRLLGEKI